MHHKITHTWTLAWIACMFDITSTFPKDVYNPDYRWIEPGDVNIGAILSIHSSSSLFNCTNTIQDIRNVQNVEAVSFAVREINDNPNILPGLKLGFDILDDCLSPSMALARAIQFMPSDVRQQNTCNESECDVPVPRDNDMFYDVVGVIGTYTSKLSITVANVLNLFHIPQISHTATSDVLSDKSRFPYFFRMVPPDRYQAMVISKLLHYFNWSHVSIVYSDGSYGREGVKRLQTLLKSEKYSVCIENIKEIGYGSDVNHIKKILHDLNSNIETKIVIAFVEIEDALLIGRSVKESGLSDRFIWIGSDSVSLVLQENKEFCEYLDGSIFVQVQPHLETVERFRKYLTDLQHDGEYIKSRNPWLRKLQAESEAVKITNTSLLTHPFDSKNGYDFKSSFIDSCLIDSVYAFALALHNVVEKRCNASLRIGKETLQDCIKRVGIYNELKTLRFSGFSGVTGFDENGDVMSTYEIHQCSRIDNMQQKLNQIGIWNMNSDELDISETNLSWPAGEIPRSSCPRPCTETSGSIYYFPQKGCCWQCIKCKVNEIVTENVTRCQSCPELYWPDLQTRTSCRRISPFHFGLQHAVSIGLCTFAIAGIVFCLWISATLFKYRNEHVIRCISLELTSMILVGTILTYGLTVSFLSEPNNTKCYINHVGYSLAFTIIYAPLLIKTNRIYRIFSAGRRTTRKPCFISKSSQVLISLLLVFIQVAIVIVSTSVEPPGVKLEMPSRTEEFVEMFCKLPRSGLLSSLTYNLLLVIVCTFYAFKTRKLPDNYKETRYIAYCVDTTLLIWVTFVPTYLTTSRAAAKVTILGVSLVLNASVIITCLFIPRLYSLYQSIRDSCPKNGQHYKDFKIVKHVVQRKRSLDLKMVDIEQDRSRRVSSAVTIMSEIVTHEFSDVIAQKSGQDRSSSESSESAQITEMDLQSHLQIPR